jgi:hypothetical protein
MSVKTEKLYKIVERAANGEINIPEFQRDFVWDKDQVAELVDSLYKDYPIGILVFWYNHKNRCYNIVDGLQRIMSVCIIFDKKPVWIRDKDYWNSLRDKYDVYVYYDNNSEKFVFVPASEKVRNSPEYVSIREIMTTKNIYELASMYKDVWNDNVNKIADGLLNLKKGIKEYEIPYYEITTDDIGAVSEIFERINSSGTEVSLADIIIARIIGGIWSGFKKEFQEFINKLTEEEYITSAEKYRIGLLRIFAGIANPNDPTPESLVRLPISQLKNYWNLTKDTVEFIFSKIRRDYGISPKDIGDIKPYITMCYLYNKFRERGFEFNLAFEWFLMRVIRGYRGTDDVINDIAKINKAGSFVEALGRLRSGLPLPSIDEIIEAGYRCKMANFLKVLMYKTDARDFIKKELNVLDSNMEKHHFFPKSIIKNKDNPNSIANCVYIHSDTNKKIRSKSPDRYIKELDIGNDDLKRHLIPLDYDLFRPVNYSKFLEERAKILVTALRIYLENLRQNKNELSLDKIYKN